MRNDLVGAESEMKRGVGLEIMEGTIWARAFRKRRQADMQQFDIDVGILFVVEHVIIEPRKSIEGSCGITSDLSQRCCHPHDEAIDSKSRKQAQLLVMQLAVDAASNRSSRLLSYSVWHAFGAPEEGDGFFLQGAQLRV